MLLLHNSINIPQESRKKFYDGLINDHSPHQASELYVDYLILFHLFITRKVKSLTVIFMDLN